MDKDTAISKAKVKAIEDKKACLVINTHGKGHEIVENEFDTDRLYYHAPGGKKMFFDVVAKVHPGGLIDYRY